MANRTNDWQYDLAKYLIAAGVVGRKQSEIISKFRNVGMAEMIEDELKALAAAGKVQRFKVPGQGRGSKQATVWRATTKIMEG